jgi:acyl carrier protein
MKKEFAKLCKIITIIFKKEKKKNLKLNKKLNSLKEFDSLNHLNLIFLIEKEFAVKFSLKDIEKIKTIGDILKFLKK